MCVIVLSSCKYNDDDLWNSVHGLEDRVAKLEEFCKQMNTNISSLQTLVTALQSNDYITGVTPITNDGEIIGYTITFAKSNSITIYNGTDGKDGVDGEDGTDAVTPTIGVKQDSDGVYYWTLNGEWLTDEHGNKIKAEGSDGKDGSDGEDGNDGADGTNGKDGITPQFKIENDYWYISYNNGETWEQLAKATGEDGKDGDSIFKAVTQDDKNVYFELTDGTIITIAKSDQAEEDTTIIQFKDESVKAICIKNWDTNKDGELSHGEATKVTSIRKFFRGTTIQSFDELQYFTSIDEIGVETFKQCKNLTTITIPQNVIWIEESAFSGCIHLNGYIGDLNEGALDKEFKLTDQSYTAEDFVDSDWITLFDSDLKTSDAIFFIGFSMNSDLDIKRVINRNPETSQKCYFIVWDKEKNQYSVLLIIMEKRFQSM